MNLSSCRLHEYLPQLTDVIRDSSLVISHCGAGSAFESLCLGIPLLVVPNPALMDNHQVELATLLEEKGHVVCGHACSHSQYLCDLCCHDVVRVQEQERKVRSPHIKKTACWQSKDHQGAQIID